MNDLQKLFVGELADLYDAEKQLIDTLPKMAQSAHCDELRAAFNEHLVETKGHARRLEEVFNTIGETPRRKTCKGMEGLIDEGELIAKEFENNTALDAGLIAAAQKVEHYEITSYGTLCTWATELGNERALSLLKENLSEEKIADKKLSQLAESGVNQQSIAHDTEKRGEFASKVASTFS